MSTPIAGANAPKRTSVVVAAEDRFGKAPTPNQELGTEYGFFDRMFYGFQDGMVFDYGDWEARDVEELMRRDYKARQIDNVLTLPIMSASRNITAGKGDTGEAEWLQNYWDLDPLNGGCKTSLDQVIALMTSAFAYKKAFFEKVWAQGTGDNAGKIVYDKLGWRPQSTCRIARDPVHGRFMGFQQEAYYTPASVVSGKVFPIFVKRQNAFVYIHGTRRDPLNGISDMEIPYWAWKTKQKIMFLWFQFLEGVALPRTIVQAQENAAKIAQDLAKLRNSGVLPVDVPDPTKTKIDTLDLSGKGAEQFMQAITFLDGCATNSVLAGFLDLTSNAASGSGPVGVHLAADASDFFLQSLESKSREIEQTVRRELFQPLVRYNFGKSAVVPQFNFEPLNAEDKTDAVTMLTDLMRSRDPALVPDEFIGMLASEVATYMGMDGAKVEAAFAKAASDAKAAAAAQQAQMATQMGQSVAGVAGAVGAATRMVKQGQTPTKATAAPNGPSGKPTPPVPPGSIANPLGGHVLPTTY